MIEPAYELDKTQHSDENAVVVNEHTAVNKEAPTDSPCQSNQEATTSNAIVENEATESVNETTSAFDIPFGSAEAKENETPNISENKNQR